MRSQNCFYKNEFKSQKFDRRFILLQWQHFDKISHLTPNNACSHKLSHNFQITVVFVTSHVTRLRTKLNS